MKLFYVMGGGLGHLYRVRTFIDQLGLSFFKILTNNPLAGKLFTEEEIVWCRGDDKSEVIAHVNSILYTVQEVELYVDSFPAGLFGELKSSPQITFKYLARRLKWNLYRALAKDCTIRYDHTYCFEELEPEHLDFVNSNSTYTTTINLNYPKPRPGRIPSGLIPTDKPIWLVVHSFIREEVEALLAYAEEVAHLEKSSPTLVVLTDQPINRTDILCFPYFPANDWFPLAEKIFTGGGFNILQQGTDFADKITAIPFPRKYDDQYWRVQRFKNKLIEA